MAVEWFKEKTNNVQKRRLLTFFSVFFYNDKLKK